MDQRIYHGNLSNSDLANAIVAHFDQGAMQVQQIGNGKFIAVQIATSPNSPSGSKTALSITLQNVEDGVLVQIGQQTWLGVAANLGISTLAAIYNPLTLLNRLDDIAQDIENLQLTDEVWKVIDDTARSIGSGFQLSDRLRKYVCEYCQTPNPPGQALCIACGAPLGGIQPFTCPNCGYVITVDESICPNCHKQVYR
ncbi:MAG: zinc ribbon domain-containing protein [Anaerolineaceae bacterium]